MEITNGAVRADLPKKPIDNPPRPKPRWPSDDEIADEIATVLASVPAETVGRRGPTPMLDALIADDERTGCGRAPRLMVAAALIHRDADERRIAEYLLRHRREIADGRRTPLALLTAARCAAEMQLRHDRGSARPIDDAALDARALEQESAGLPDAPSVGDLVARRLSELMGAEIEPQAWLLDSVAVFVELAQRHVLNGGQVPALLAMRTDARPSSRLVTYLRAELRNDVAAANAARLLVGPDRSPIESALLWWCTKPGVKAQDVPADVRQRWERAIQSVTTALEPSSSIRPACMTAADRARPHRMNFAPRVVTNTDKQRNTVPGVHGFQGRSERQTTVVLGRTAW